MTPSRRLLLLGLILVGTQLTGCYCCRPLFPRLPLCGQGACCTGSVFPRLAGAYPVAAGGVPVGPVAVSTGGYDPGCVGCGSGGGIPIADAGQVYHGAPIATTPAPAGSPPTSTPLGFPGGSVPMNMPGGGVSYGGIPFDSALNTPTVTPPTAAKKLDVPADGRKIVTAGK
jgi:hypothetical protein